MKNTHEDGKKLASSKPGLARSKPRSRKSREDKDLVYIMVGYNQHDPDRTGCLGFEDLSKGIGLYKIVGIDEAVRFHSTNVDNIKGFGTPEQWLSFFNTEPELDGWRFHLVKVLS